MLGLLPSSALPISDIYTIPRGTAVVAVSGVQASVPAPTVANGSAQIQFYVTNGVQAACSLNMISDLYLMNKHRHMYLQPGTTLTGAIGNAGGTTKAVFALAGTQASGQIGNVIAQGTFVFPTGNEMQGILGTDYVGDRFDYWTKIKPTGTPGWNQIVVPKPTK